MHHYYNNNFLLYVFFVYFIFFLIRDPYLTFYQQLFSSSFLNFVIFQWETASRTEKTFLDWKTHKSDWKSYFRERYFWDISENCFLHLHKGLREIFSYNMRIMVFITFFFLDDYITCKLLLLTTFFLEL
jgi:hypothetical protein